MLFHVYLAMYMILYNS